MQDDYDLVAWCTRFSPSSHEYFERMSVAGVKATVVCIHESGIGQAPYGEAQTKASRSAGLVTNAGSITDLYNPEIDAKEFAKEMHRLSYDGKVRVAIMALPDKMIDHPEERIARYIDELSNYCLPENIDVCIDRKYVLDGRICPEMLPKSLNLTVINQGHLNAGVAYAGTWIFDNRFEGEEQLIGYDIFQYYTRPNQLRGFQLDLTGEYVARMGDSWWIIAEKHGLPVIDLLTLNEADLSDRIMPGQRIKVM